MYKRFASRGGVDVRWLCLTPLLIMLLVLMTHPPLPEDQQAFAGLKLPRSLLVLGDPCAASQSRDLPRVSPQC